MIRDETLFPTDDLALLTIGLADEIIIPVLSAEERIRGKGVLPAEERTTLSPLDPGRLTIDLHHFRHTRPPYSTIIIGGKRPLVLTVTSAGITIHQYESRYSMLWRRLARIGIYSLKRPAFTTFHSPAFVALDNIGALGEAVYECLLWRWHH